MTTQKIAKREPKLPAVTDEDMLGVSGDLGPEDIVTPVCSIVQPTSASERGEPGRYWWPDSAAVEEMEVIVLTFAGTRTLWAPMGESDGGPVCRSSDRREGMTTKPSVVLGESAAKAQNITDGLKVYIPCEVCPHHKDDVYSSGDWLCKPGYSIMLFNEERGPFLFFVKGKATPIIMRTIVSPVLMRIKRGLPAMPWDTKYRWATRRIENERGKFYVPEITPLGRVDNPERYLQMASDLRGSISRQMETAVEEEGGQGGMFNEES